MDSLKKLQLLGKAARYEPAEDISLTGDPLPTPRVPEELIGCIHQAATPRGRIPLLKTLLSSACERDCAYCPFRSGRDFQRATFTPDELARLFLRIHQSGLVKGIFLSSGLAGKGPRVQDRIIATAEILRKRYHFQGYIHLKIMPGAERDQISAGMALADRVSLNLEAPNQKRLHALAPHKHFDGELLQRLQWVEAIRQEAPDLHWPSATTQFVVGPSGESDVELLLTTEYLYHHLRLRRAYFSAFAPVIDTPLENHTPTSPQREYRLYQASFLLRDYGFCAEELSFEKNGNLLLEEDPKLAWAKTHLLEAPIEVNTADREMLLRIPGIGPKGVDRLLTARRQGTLQDLSNLSKLGIATHRAAPFIQMDGKQSPRQLRLF